MEAHPRFYPVYSNRPLGAPKPLPTPTVCDIDGCTCACHFGPRLTPLSSRTSMPKAKGLGVFQRRRWLASQECHNLCMILSSLKCSGAQPAIVQTLNLIVLHFLKPPDYLMVHGRHDSAMIDLGTHEVMQTFDGPWTEVGPLKVSPGGEYIFATPYQEDSGNGSGVRICGYEARSLTQLSRFQLPSFSDGLAVSRHHVAASHTFTEECMPHLNDCGIVLLESPGLVLVCKTSLPLGPTEEVTDLMFAKS